MDKGFKYVGNGVIKDTESDKYYTRVDSKRQLNGKVYNEDKSYGVYAVDIEIELDKKDSFTDAVMLMFSRENEEDNLPSTSYMDMICCNLLGTYISDWY